MPSTSCTSRTLSAWVAGPLITAPVAMSNREPWHWHMIVVPVSKPPESGHRSSRHEFAKLIWRTASPKWNFDDATFERSAASFDNPDHVAIVIDNYRWRLGLTDGESAYLDLEDRLAQGPVITVPAITLEGDANGAPHPEPAAYAAKFAGPYSHRTIAGGIGHNLPQEAPDAFASAVREVGDLR
jgi:pimeloyl-ACP methyl ester carboxylesterase